MYFAQKLLLNYSSFVLCLVFIGIAVSFSVCGLIITRRLVSHRRLKLHNDVAGPLFSTVGVVYAVLLAFVVIIVWGDFDKNNLNTEKEAIRLSSLYRDSQVFGQEFQSQAGILFKQYADLTVNQEWKTMPFGGASQEVNETVGKIFSLYGGYVPKNPAEQAFYGESVRALNELVDLRSLRLVAARTGVHPLLWLVLIVGGVVTITFTFFSARRISIHKW